MIPIYRPSLGEKETAYVLEAVRSSWVSSKGVFLDRFEREFAAYVGTRHGMATCNGTVSLHLLLAALGVGPGDEVVVPTFTYVASVNAISYTGATPVFVDADRYTWNLDPTLVAAAITARTKAIMAVHLYGHPADMDPLAEIAAERGISLIEDAAEAHGALYKGRRVGSLSRAASFSFFGNKVITTGEGGMVVTADDELAERCRHLRGQGVSPTRTYWHDEIGFNYRMTNVAAALGVAQLERIDEILERKKAIAAAYVERLAGIPELTLSPQAPWAASVYWMYSILVPPADRDPLMAHLAQNGVDSRPFFHPAHTLPMYRSERQFPVAEALGRSGINLPSFPDLTADELEVVTSAVRTYFARGATGP